MNKYWLALRWILLIVQSVVITVVGFLTVIPFMLVRMAIAQITEKKVCRAAYNNDLDLLQVGLDRGESIDVIQHGEAALHIASKKGYEAFVRALVESGASINLKNKMGRTPLDLAVISKKTAVAEFLIEQGAEPSLFTQVIQGDVESVSNQLEAGKDPNTSFGGFGTLLYLATKHAPIEMVQTLLAHGANVNAQTSSGETPLHVAAERGDLQLVRLLVENGARVKFKPETETPLHEAASKGHSDVVQYLIQHGADVNARDRFPVGKTPLFEAIGSGDADTVEVLLANGADINLKIWIGISPLKLAENYPAIMDVINRYCQTSSSSE